MSHVIDSEGLSLYEAFLRFRALGDGRALAEATLSHPAFKRKFKEAFHISMQGVRNVRDSWNEVKGTAQRTIAHHLQATCAADFHDRGFDHFMGFIYVLCRRNITWARNSLLRNMRQTMHETPLPNDPGSKGFTSSDVSEHVYSKLTYIVEKTVASWEEPHLRTAVLHLLEGKPIAETAAKLGCTERTVRNYRMEGIERLRRTFNDELP